MDRRVIGALVAVAVGSTLGCAPGSATIKSTKREGYDQKLGKTMLLVELPRLEGDLVKAFKATLQKELALRGAETRFAVLADDLAVDTGPSVKKQAEDFGASWVLAILPNGGTVNQYGGVVRARMDTQLHDLKLGKIVWRAAVDYTPGSIEVPVEFRAEVLCYEFIVAMVSDGVLRGPLPAKPERLPEPTVRSAQDR